MRRTGSLREVYYRMLTGEQGGAMHLNPVQEARRMRSSFALSPQANPAFVSSH